MRQIVVITSYPPQPCGIATYSHDLIAAMKAVSNDYRFIVCALENGKATYQYDDIVRYILDTSDSDAYGDLAERINNDPDIDAVYVQHEFGLYEGTHGANLLLLMYSLTKPIIVTFHTAIPNPAPLMRTVVKSITVVAERVIVMTNHARDVLQSDYLVDPAKIEVIAHGTHGINHIDRNVLKQKYQLEGRTVLSTFGLLSEGKSIETTLYAMPAIVEKFPDCIFLALGRTHPVIMKKDGEVYRTSLHQRVKLLGLENHVRFVNNYLSLQELLEYLQLTDLYLFTSKDPLQAVSGTFSYALSAGCPIVSTPIPHAREVLNPDVGFLFDFLDSTQLASKVISLLNDPERIQRMRINALQKMQPTLWENSALAHIMTFKKALNEQSGIDYVFPQPTLQHLQKMTTKQGIVQFAKLTIPDLESGYTLDDNARALIAACLVHDLNSDDSALELMPVYLNFIGKCQQDTGRFINYIDSKGEPHEMNRYVNLEDSNGRAIWALGHFLKCRPDELRDLDQAATEYLEKTLGWIDELHSPRAIAFAIKGLRLYNEVNRQRRVSTLIRALADKLMFRYKESSMDDWRWFESYLTYGNAVLPESLLHAWMETGRDEYLETAKEAFDFLLTHTFINGQIRVISNRGWKNQNGEQEIYGEQPIDVAYTVLALVAFSDVFRDVASYREKIFQAMAWFYGKNHLDRYVYSMASGGCYDGLEQSNVNLNQGAESTACYLIARSAVEQYELERASEELHISDQEFDNVGVRGSDKVTHLVTPG